MHLLCKGCTALHVASQYNHLAVVKELIKAGSNIESNTSKKYTPLLLAVKFGHKKVIKLNIYYKVLVIFKYIYNNILVVIKYIYYKVLVVFK